jgi:hypothetical protein
MVSENFSWVFPPANVPPATIGPVHLYDTIALSWTPSSLYIAPPYKLQMACLLANQSMYATLLHWNSLTDNLTFPKIGYVFVPITNVSSPHLWFFKENYDTQPYSCWWGFETPPGGKGETDAAFSVVPTTAATAITFSATSTSSPSASPTNSMQTTGAAAGTTTSAAVTSAATSAVAAPDSGLSSGAKAGIGIGVALGVIALLALVVAIFFLRRRKSRRKLVPNTSGREMDVQNPYEKPPLAYAEAEAPYPYAEADGQEARHELHA